MRRILTVCAFAAAAMPAAANTLGCGDNAYSFAEVVEHAPGVRAKGPLVSVPDSLCADLIEDRAPAIGSLGVHVGEPYGGDADAASRLRGRSPPR